MKLFLAGEGKDELGDWYKEPPYRDGTSFPGLVEAFLLRLQIDFEVIEGRIWKKILKYKSGDFRSKETNNVMGAAQEALDYGCDALVFVRDSGSDKDREEQVAQGIENARRSFPALKICGGLAVQEIEAWLLALRGETKSESHRDPKKILRESKESADTRAEKVAIIESADLSRHAPDANSLAAWLESVGSLRI